MNVQGTELCEATLLVEEGRGDGAGGGNQEQMDRLMTPPPLPRPEQRRDCHSNPSMGICASADLCVGGRRGGCVMALRVLRLNRSP